MKMNQILHLSHMIPKEPEQCNNFLVSMLQTGRQPLIKAVFRFNVYVHNRLLLIFLKFVLHKVSVFDKPEIRIEQNSHIGSRDLYRAAAVIPGFVHYS